METKLETKLFQENEMSAALYSKNLILGLECFFA